MDMWWHWGKNRKRKAGIKVETNNEKGAVKERGRERENVRE
jgi:hypothetical protein